MKKFLISIDTEGDNLWKWKKGDSIYTENTKYLDRFQNLCNQYGFKPTYLTNYEMISNPSFAKWLKKKAINGELEVGMHLHAWSTPPFVELGNISTVPAQPYLIEYGDEIVSQKINTMTELLENRIEQPIVTHRSGRWAMDDRYFAELVKHGYKVDCSVTPHVDWSSYSGETIGSKGSDYSHMPEQPYSMQTPVGKITEVPVTIRISHKLFVNSHSPRKMLGSVKKAIAGEKVWLRPNGSNLKQMLWLIDYVSNDESTDYIMFMLHSSEFMPGGSPTFADAESIERLYAHMKIIFDKLAVHFEGETIGMFGEKLQHKV